VQREHVPYVPPERTLPEVTRKGVVLGLVLAVVLGAANTYLGLKVGLTVSASIPAAVISMAVLRAFRRYNILENNAVQTAASAGESLAAGVLFTVPALLLLDYWTEIDYWETTLVALAGGVLGVLFTVPLRRALIVEARLTFPEGVATSEVLKTGGVGRTGDPADAPAKGASGIAALVLGGVAGLAYKFMETGLAMWRSTAGFAVRIREQGVAAFGIDLAPALLGVGYIVGLRIALLVFAGGVLGWLVAMPVYSLTADGASFIDGFTEAFRQGLAEAGDAVRDPTLSEVAAGVWSGQVRYIGVGAMLIGGLWSLVKLRKPLGQALFQGLGSGREGASAPLRTEREFGIRATFVGVLGMVVPIFLLYWYATRSLGVLPSLGIAAVMAVLMVLTGFLFSAVAGYMAGLVGSSNNPISGVTILTVLTAAFTLKVLGVPSDLGPAATILVAAVIACAGAIAGDNMQDLKTGHILGSTPKRQQTMQVLGVAAAAFALAPVLQLLHEAYTIGSTDLPAPQAGLMAAVGTFVFEGGLPMVMVAAGAGLAVLLVILDEVLESRGAAFRTPVMPVAVGIYLPVGLSAPIFLGGLVAWLVARAYRRAPDRKEQGVRNGVLFSSGAIAGEALVGIAVAVLIAFDMHRFIVVSDAGLVWPGLLLFSFLAVLLWYVGVRPLYVEEERA